MKPLLLLALLFAPPAYAPPLTTAPQCTGVVARSLVRAARSGLQESIAALTPNELIQQLIVLQIEEYRRYEPGMRNGLRSGRFDPFWVFRNGSATELLVDNFPVGYRLWSAQGQELDTSIAQFVAEWERVYCANGGRPSSRWTGERRREFIRRLILELAFAHQEGVGIRQGGQPLPMTATADAELSLLAGAAVLRQFFGSTDDFQREFDAFARERLGTRIPWFPAVNRAAVRDVARQLRARGVTAPTVERPHRNAAERVRQENELLAQALPQFSPEGRFPLARVLTTVSLGGPGESRFQLVAQNGHVIRRVFEDGYAGLVRALYARRGAPLPASFDVVASWPQEILVQCACLYVWENGGLAAFRAAGGQFQTHDRSAPFYVDEDHELLSEAGVDAEWLSRFVLYRL